MKKKYKFLIVVILILIFIFSPLFQFVKSVTVMYVYSQYEKSYSLLRDEHIKLDMKGGLSTREKDWYPFVMTFNADYGFSNYIGRDVRLSILYNFGAFEYLEGASSYYNKQSDYFNAFYGAYVVKEDKFFGYNDDLTPNFEEMASVPKYDMTVLVLRSIGCKNPTFEFDINATYTVDEYLGLSDWDVIDATITTNSPMHQYQDNHQAYIQYGKPPETYYEDIDFELIEIKGRIYAKYIKDKGYTIFFYVIAPTNEIIEKCDRQMLQNTILEL